MVSTQLSLQQSPSLSQRAPKILQSATHNPKKQFPLLQSPFELQKRPLLHLPQSALQSRPLLPAPHRSCTGGQNYNFCRVH